MQHIYNMEPAKEAEPGNGVETVKEEEQGDWTEPAEVEGPGKWSQPECLGSRVESTGK